MLSVYEMFLSAQVAAVQRTFIGQLVKAGHFSRQLAALREIDAILACVDGLPEYARRLLLEVTHIAEP